MSKQDAMPGQQEQSCNQEEPNESTVHCSNLMPDLATEINLIRMARPAIIAIDGPAGAGKSTIGHQLATVLDFLFFDTGIMYRAVTWAAFNHRLDLHDADAVGRMTAAMNLDVTPVADVDQALLAAGTYCYVHVDGADITSQLRTPAIDRNVSVISAHAQVRQALSAQQRRIGLRYGQGDAEKAGIVMAGRDVGTAVLPDAPLKIYMVASLVERARRRYCEQRLKGKEVTLSQTLQAMEQRDQIDSARAVSPLRPARDAIQLDTSTLSKDEVIETILIMAVDQLLVG